MGLISPEKIEEYGKETFPQYSSEEMEILRKKYTPEQMAALEAGEAAIDPKDLTIQGRVRRDPYRLPYLDDFSKIYPVIDKRPKTLPPPNPEARFMTNEEHALDLEKRLEALIPKDVDFRGMSEHQIQEVLSQRIDFNMVEAKYFLEPETMVNTNGPTNTALAPALGKKLSGVAGKYKAPVDPEDNGMDELGVYKQVKRRTGLTINQIMDITVKVLVIRHVHNQSRLGKIRSIWMLAIAGNGHGILGIGEAKSVEPEVARQKARLKALMNLRPIRRYEDRTIFGSVQGKVGATIVQIDARPPGELYTYLHDTFFFKLLSSTCTFADIFVRLWPARLPPSLRDLPRRGHQRRSGQDAAVEKPDELGQGLRSGSAEPARSQRTRHRQRQEVGRRAEGVLWWKCILIG